MTHVEICNMALALVKKEAIVSLDDDSVQGRACKALYYVARDKALEDRIWSFSKLQYVLTEKSTEPLFGFANSFALPGEVIRVHSIVDGDGEPVVYEVHGRYIYSDEDTLYVTAATKEVDASLYTPGFCAAVAFFLAHLLAVPLAENRELKQEYLANYRMTLKEASGADGVGQSGIGRNALATKWKDRRG